MPMLLNPFVAGPPQTIMEMITNAGLTSSLVLCLDAGDSASYDGTSQTWTDRSGLGNSFKRGTTSGADSSDPTFSGTAGGKSSNEYFSVDAADSFEPNAAMTLAHNWHKNNARFSIGFVMYADQNDITSTSPSVFATTDSATTPGMAIKASSTTGRIFLYVDSGSATVLNTYLDSSGDPHPLPTSREWFCRIISFDEATGNIIHKYSSAAPYTGTVSQYVSPSASSPGSYNILWDSYTGNNTHWESGVRIAAIFAWDNRNLTTDEMNVLYDFIRKRFPTLP
jgi:hypothetical protein